MDLLVAVCLAKVARLHHSREVGLRFETRRVVFHGPLQLVRQDEERERYGKGVEVLLVKKNPTLPLMVAAA